MSSFEVTNSSGDANFPTKRRLKRRPLKLEDLPSLPELEAWRQSIGFNIGPAADTPERRRLAIGIFWIWKDVHAENDSDLCITDLIQYELQMAPNTIPHATPF